MRFLKVCLVSLVFMSLVLLGLGFYAQQQSAQVMNNLAEEEHLAQQLLAYQDSPTSSAQLKDIAAEALAELPQAALRTAKEQNTAQASSTEQEVFESTFSLALTADASDKQTFAARTAYRWLQATQNPLDMAVVDRALKHELVGSCQVPVQASAEPVTADQKNSADALADLVQSLYSQRYFSQVAAARATIEKLSDQDLQSIRKAGQDASLALKALEEESGCYAAVFQQFPAYEMQAGTPTEVLNFHRHQVAGNIYATLMDPRYSSQEDLRRVLLAILLSSPHQQ